MPSVFVIRPEPEPRPVRLGLPVIESTSTSSCGTLIPDIDVLVKKSRCALRDGPSVTLVTPPLKLTTLATIARRGALTVIRQLCGSEPPPTWRPPDDVVSAGRSTEIA